MDERGHFRIGGVPVRVEWPFFLVAALLGVAGMRAWPDQSFVGRITFIAIWVAISFVSVLVHELGHAIAFRLNRERPAIVLTAMWGLTSAPEPRSKARRIAVSVAGALFAMVVLGIPFLLWRNPMRDAVRDAFTYKRYLVVYYVGYVNLWWSVANLLPILPLDGGNISRELVGLHRTRIAGTVVGFLLALYLWLTGYSYAGLFLAMLAFMNLAELMQARAGMADGYGGSWRDARPEPPPPQEKPKRTKQGRGLFGRRQPHLSVVPPPEPGLGGPNTDGARLEAAAWDALRGGDNDEAARLLLEATGRTGVSPHLPAALAAAEGRPDDAVTLFQRAFASAPTPPNLVAATVIARAGIAERVAEELLGPLGPGPDAAAGLQNHLHYARCFPEAARVGELLVADGRRSRAQSSFETACAWAQAGEAERALGWLAKAVDEGFRARSLIEAEDDLAPVRALAGYAQVQARLDGAPS